MFSPDDTIVSIATPPGRGGIGVVRVSGPEAGAIGLALTGRTAPSRLDARRWRACAPAGAAIDRAVLTFFPAPHSYTGDDVLEISAHGSPVLLGAIVDASMSAGARLAEPGEFTFRAYLHGRIDLVQAEAVQDLVAAVTPLQARAAFDQLEGTLTTRIREIDAELFDLVGPARGVARFSGRGLSLRRSANPRRAEILAIVARHRRAAGGRRARPAGARRGAGRDRRQAELREIEPVQPPGRRRARDRHRHSRHDARSRDRGRRHRRASRSRSSTPPGCVPRRRTPWRKKASHGRTRRGAWPISPSWCSIARSRSGRTIARSSRSPRRRRAIVVANKSDLEPAMDRGRVSRRRDPAGVGDDRRRDRRAARRGDARARGARAHARYAGGDEHPSRRSAGARAPRRCGAPRRRPPPGRRRSSSPRTSARRARRLEEITGARTRDDVLHAIFDRFCIGK